MKILQIIFTIPYAIGFIGNGFLLLWIEWTFIRQNFIQIFNPFLQVLVIGKLLVTPLFWIFLLMTLIGCFAVAAIGWKNK